MLTPGCFPPGLFASGMAAPKRAYSPVGGGSLDGFSVCIVLGVDLGFSLK